MWTFPFFLKWVGKAGQGQAKGKARALAGGCSTILKGAKPFFNRLERFGMNLAAF